jgi:hypothetical protein
MTLSSDKRLQELNRLIQVETDPRKIVQLSEEFGRRLMELQKVDPSKPVDDPAKRDAK